MSDPAADFGGVAFDDDFDVAGSSDGVDRGGSTTVHDSAESLQRRGIAYPTTAPAGMRVLRQYVLTRWSGVDLGILAQPPRSVRAGSTPSMHNWGMAWDWRWAAPGPGRQAADEVIEFALAESARLGIQAVHDYVNARYWKNDVGWRTAHSSPSTGFGQPWSQWLHIERTWDSANSPDPIDGLSTRVAAAAAPASPVAHDAVGAPTFEGDLPTGPVRRGDSGADVARIQDFLRATGFADFTISDGEFGPRTDAAVRAAQAAFVAKGLYTKAVDGIWGPATASAAARFGGA
ncbi:MAG: peptidoglycan-binding protein [Ilumatobacteraceae bacterium]